uniref:ADAM metallopeptidase domain 12 n=1 Tax=Amphiprion percula TaxID=161767 RepID=A0A3P8U2J9_AMPPE
ASLSLSLYLLYSRSCIVQFQKQGKDMEKVKQRLAEIANYVDKFYRALNIRVALVGLEVWSDVDKCPITQDPFTTLHEFLDWRKVKLLPQKPHDNAQLISGVYFQGTTIGMAPIMSMCTAEQSGGIDHSDNPLGAAVTLAHELGHNFGMNHDTPERGCGCRVTGNQCENTLQYLQHRPDCSAPRPSNRSYHLMPSPLARPLQ